MGSMVPRAAGLPPVAATTPVATPGIATVFTHSPAILARTRFPFDRVSDASRIPPQCAGGCTLPWSAVIQHWTRFPATHRQAGQRRAWEPHDRPSHAGYGVAHRNLS